MDKLEAVRIASRDLDQAADEELTAHRAWMKAKDRLSEADRNYAAALDALHDGEAAQGIDCRSVA